MAVRRRGKRWAVEVYDRTTASKRQVGTFDTWREAKNRPSGRHGGCAAGRRGGETVGGFADRWRPSPAPKESTNVAYPGAGQAVRPDQHGDLALRDVGDPACYEWLTLDPERDPRDVLRRAGWTSWIEPVRRPAAAGCARPEGSRRSVGRPGSRARFVLARVWTGEVALECPRARPPRCLHRHAPRRALRVALGRLGLSRERDPRRASVLAADAPVRVAEERQAQGHRPDAAGEGRALRATTSRRFGVDRFPS